jgi:MYXO-CTERM domain-containing protein
MATRSGTLRIDQQLNQEASIMKTILLTISLSISLAVMTAQTAQAGHLGLGGPGGLGLGGHRGEFGRGGFGGGFGGGHSSGLDTEAMQTRFETKFDDLQTDYDTGLAEIEDFYSSDEYGDVVDGMESLVDRYDWFLTGVERTIERLGDFISTATEDLAIYDEILAKYEADESLSAERLERLTTRINDIQDSLTIKIDYLTIKQTSLTENLGTYEAFSTDLATYLADVVAAGGGTTDNNEVTSVLSLISEAPIAALATTEMVDDHASFCDATQTPVEATAAPEPSGVLIGLLTLGLLAAYRPRRRNTA